VTGEQAVRTVAPFGHAITASLKPVSQHEEVNNPDHKGRGFFMVPSDSR